MKKGTIIFEESGLKLIQSVRPLYAKTAITDVCVENVLYALDSAIRSDYIVRLVVTKSKKLYPGELRLVKAPDPDSGEIITFVTNNVDIPAIEIANIYRHRWDIEVFFKWIRQKHLHKASVGLLRKCG